MIRPATENLCFNDMHIYANEVKLPKNPKFSDCGLISCENVQKHAAIEYLCISPILALSVVQRVINQGLIQMCW